MLSLNLQVNVKPLKENTDEDRKVRKGVKFLEDMGQLVGVYIDLSIANRHLRQRVLWNKEDGTRCRKSVL
jgi:hypothetical protein